MPTERVEGKRVFWAKSPGGDPPAILIHGAGGSRLHWPAQLRRLSSTAVYAIDLPGHGRSEGPARSSIEAYAADVERFLAARGLEQVVLIGHSMGGAIAQVVTLSVPERVAGLVLLGTGAKLGVAPQLLEGLGEDFEGAVDLIAEWAWAPSADPKLVAEGRRVMLEAGSEVLLNDFLACDRFDIRDRVQEIAVPSLVLTGSEDLMTPPRFGRWLVERIPNAQFHLVEGAGHMLMLERPREVARKIREFLSEIA